MSELITINSMDEIDWSLAPKEAKIACSDGNGLIAWGASNNIKLLEELCGFRVMDDVSFSDGCWWKDSPYRLAEGIDWRTTLTKRPEPGEEERHDIIADGVSLKQTLNKLFLTPDSKEEKPKIKIGQEWLTPFGDYYKIEDRPKLESSLSDFVDEVEKQDEEILLTPEEPAAGEIINAAPIKDKSAAITFGNRILGYTDLLKDDDE